jgi:uroporphyrinogen decarboxylase
VNKRTDSLPSNLSKAGTARLSSRERFLSACLARKVDRPPVWLMRQAGRCLPEYRKLRESYGFLELVKEPKLAAEVTLQPIRHFGFDAAILFSDILVVPEGLGQSYSFGDKGGVQMAFAINSEADIKRLDPKFVVERLHYVREALLLSRKMLGEETALLGFSGAPWTLANFMLEGGSSKEFSKAKDLFYCNRPLFDRLCEILSIAVAEYLRMQIKTGVIDAVQIFDTLAGTLAGRDLEAASVGWIKQLIADLKSEVPVIVFCKGANGDWKLLSETGARVLGVDWTVPLRRVSEQLPANVAVQGNLDPHLLLTTPEVVALQTERLLKDMRGAAGHIVNLGHGVPPTAKLECIEALVQTVKTFVNRKS